MRSFCSTQLSWRRFAKTEKRPSTCYAFTPIEWANKFLGQNAAGSSFLRRSNRTSAPWAIALFKQHMKTPIYTRFDRHEAQKAENPKLCVGCRTCADLVVTAFSVEKRARCRIRSAVSPVRPPRNRIQSRRLRKVYQLRRVPNGVTEVTRLRGADAVEVLMQNVHPPGLEPGRRSTYQPGIPVQTNRASSDRCHSR